MPEDPPQQLTVLPVLAYATALTSHAMCIVELSVPGTPSHSLCFRLSPADAAALALAILDTAAQAARLAAAPALRH